jgi:hypothetical protein
MLKHHAAVPARPGDRNIVYDDAPLRGRAESPQRGKQGAFAAAGGPKDADKLPRRHPEGHIFQGGKETISFAVVYPQVFNFDLVHPMILLPLANTLSPRNIVSQKLQ